MAQGSPVVRTSYGRLNVRQEQDGSWVVERGRAYPDGRFESEERVGVFSSYQELVDLHYLIGHIKSATEGGQKM